VDNSTTCVVFLNLCMFFCCLKQPFLATTY
jgi:hypothetical protein